MSKSAKNEKLWSMKEKYLIPSDIIFKLEESNLTHDQIDAIGKALEAAYKWGQLNPG